MAQSSHFGQHSSLGTAAESVSREGWVWRSNPETHGNM